MVTNAPVKDELATHDGIIYFPRELMPPEKQEDIQKSARLGFHGNAVPAFLLKTKKLNFKLKFKKASLKRF